MVNELHAAGAIDCIHDFTVAYPSGLIQDESDLADGKMPKEGNFFNFELFSNFFLVHFSIKRYPIDTVPTENSETLSAWLNERWVEKEKKLKQFYVDREFHDVRQPFWDKRSISIWIALIFWPLFRYFH